MEVIVSQKSTDLKLLPYNLIFYKVWTYITRYLSKDKVILVQIQFVGNTETLHTHTQTNYWHLIQKRN